METHQINRLNDQGLINQFIRYGEVYEDPKKVKELLLTVVKNGSPSVDENPKGPDGLKYVYEVPNTPGPRKKFVTVIVGNNGYIVNAIPSNQR